MLTSRLQIGIIVEEEKGIDASATSSNVYVGCTRPLMCALTMVLAGRPRGCIDSHQASKPQRSKIMFTKPCLVHWLASTASSLEPDLESVI